MLLDMDIDYRRSCRPTPSSTAWNPLPMPERGFYVTDTEHIG